MSQYRGACVDRGAQVADLHGFAILRLVLLDLLCQLVLQRVYRLLQELSLPAC